jgi:hypothetical protein
MSSIVDRSSTVRINMFIAGKPKKFAMSGNRIKMPRTSRRPKSSKKKSLEQIRQGGAMLDKPFFEEGTLLGPAGGEDADPPADGKYDN